LADVLPRSGVGGPSVVSDCLRTEVVIRAAQPLASLEVVVLAMLSTDVVDRSAWFVAHGGGPANGLLGHPSRRRQVRQV